MLSFLLAFGSVISIAHAQSNLYPGLLPESSMVTQNVDLETISQLVHTEFDHIRYLHQQMIEIPRMNTDSACGHLHNLEYRIQRIDEIYSMIRPSLAMTRVYLRRLNLSRSEVSMYMSMFNMNVHDMLSQIDRSLAVYRARQLMERMLVMRMNQIRSMAMQDQLELRRTLPMCSYMTLRDRILRAD